MSHTFSLSNLTPARRLVGLSLLSGAALLLAACGSSKPKPMPLEQFTPSAKVSVAWSQRLSTAKGPLTLAVANGSVTFAGSDGKVLSLDVQTGKERWRANAGADLSAAVGSDGRHAAVVTTGNVLIAFDQGKELWRERQGGRVITAPLVAGERVFVQGVDRSVRAYDVLDGRWLWNYQRPGSEPLALTAPGLLSSFRDTLVVGQGARLVGLDPLHGTPRFDFVVAVPRGTNEVERLADLIGPAARVDDEMCLRSFQFSVACVELNRGSLRWTRQQAGTKAVAANDELVVGADGSDRLSAWRTSNGDALWRVERFLHRGLSAPAVWGSRVAVADAEGQLHVLAADDGRTLARLSLDGPLSAAPVVVDDLLLVTTRPGTLYALRAN